MAVAEQAMEFEHRDLHWGNVLVKEVKGVKVCEFRLDGDLFKVHINIPKSHHYEISCMIRYCWKRCQ